MRSFDKRTGEKRIVDEFVRFQRVALLLSGVGLVARGFQVWLDPDIINPEWAILHDMLPLWFRITLWITTGTVAIVAAITWCIPFGYAAAIVMPLERMFSYAWSSLMWFWPGEPPGHLGSLAWFLWWLAVTGVVILPGLWPLVTTRCKKRKV